MNNSLKWILTLVGLGLAFYAGMWWQRNLYLDKCLDMGGGVNPEGYPICAITKVEEKPTSTTKINYDCAKKANISVEMPDPEFVRVLVTGSDTIEFSAIISPTGSGAKYMSEDKKYTFWSQGDECMILEGEKTIYQSCKEIK